MNSCNLIILTGRLGDAPIIRQAGDIEVASLSLATDHSWFNKKKLNDQGQEGAWESKTTWHRVVVWRPTKSIKEAEKGRLVHIQGRYESNSWQDGTTGETRYSMEVIADKCWVLPKGGGAFKTESEKEAKKEATNDLDAALGGPQDAGFPDEAPPV